VSDEHRISVTLKAGGNTADPWIVVRGDTVQEVGDLIKGIRDNGVFGAVQRISAEFANGGQSTESAVETVRESFPGAEVVSDQQLPDEHKCQTCGARAEFKSGTSKAGKSYRMWKCTRDRDHQPEWV